MASMNTLEDLFVHELQDIYDAENQIVKALPKMAKAASTPELRQAFEQHLQQSQQQAQRIEQVFQLMGAKVKGKTCKAMQGLVAEGQELMGEKAEPNVMDAGLIAAAQKVEHYEIASYGTVITWANQLGHREAAQLLKQNLAEEEQTDKLLSNLAERMVNQKAANA
jgi:ferritin-like metal-binding protein YciE